jgi:predicted O-methyltransferase YrrM
MASHPSDGLSKRLLRMVLPDPLYEVGKIRFLSRQARVLRDRCTGAQSLPAKVDLVLASRYFRPDQKKAEVVQLLELVDSMNPRHLCEIGGRVGGSLALFSQVAADDARLLSIDIGYKPAQAHALAHFARRR